MKPILLIIEREFMTRVKKKSFIIMSLLTPMLIALSIFVSIWISSTKDTDEQRIGVVDCTAWAGAKLNNTGHIVFHAMDVISPDSIKTLAQHAGEGFTVFYIAGEPGGIPTDFVLYSDRQVNVDVRAYVERSMNKILEDFKLKQHDIPELDKILEEVKTNIDLRTIKLGKDGSATETNSYVLMGISYIGAMMIYMFIFMFGTMVMRGVIEEKSNRIVEVLISSLKPFELMMGKIIGIASVGLLQFTIWVVLTVGLTTVAQSVMLQADGGKAGVHTQMEAQQGVMGNAGMHMPGSEPAIDMSQANAVQKVLLTLSSINLPLILFTFLIYFLGGYLLYASMFASIGSAVESEAETQQLMLPVTIPLIIGLMMMAHTFQYPNSSLSFWASMVPFTSPMVMMARIPFGVPAWQLLLSIGLLTGTFVLFTFFAGKIYRIGILMYGKKPSLKEIWRWIRYK